ncbi:MAG: HIT family protein, partial [Methanoregula sp.]|nr:HIT family protein [Methanoregula sp.]
MPFRHTLDLFSMTPAERVALISLIDTCKGVIEAEFSPAGYNIGFNVGVAAGQTVMHCHCHECPESTGCPAWVIRGRGVVPGYPRNKLKKDLRPGLFLPVSDNSRKVFVRILFQPLFSFFGIIAASRVIHLEEP